eukprot:SAG31_NODE_11910_length_987_cov_0.826577_1_plen_266_part_10
MFSPHALGLCLCMRSLAAAWQQPPAHANRPSSMAAAGTVQHHAWQQSSAASSTIQDYNKRPEQRQMNAIPMAPPLVFDNARDPSPGVSLVLNESANGTWWTGVSLIGGLWGRKVFMASVGNWYTPPYPFWVEAIPLDGGVALWKAPTVPGAIVGAGGKGCYFLVFVQLFEKQGTLIERNTALIEKASALIGVNSNAAFVGQNFALPSHPMTYASFAANNAMPEWSVTPPGAAGNWWQTAAPIQTSANGSIVAYGQSRLDYYDPLAP